MSFACFQSVHVPAYNFCCCDHGCYLPADSNLRLPHRSWYFLWLYAILQMDQDPTVEAVFRHRPLAAKVVGFLTDNPTCQVLGSPCYRSGYQLCLVNTAWSTHGRSELLVQHSFPQGHRMVFQWQQLVSLWFQQPPSRIPTGQPFKVYMQSLWPV